jgi:hypothetical protein
VLPTEEDKWLHYKDIRKQLKVPYVIYAYFESLQVPIQGPENDPEISSTIKTTKYIPCGFTYKVVGLTNKTSKQPVVYWGLDAADKFVEHMVKEQEEIGQKFKHCEPIIMTGSDWQAFKKTSNCHEKIESETTVTWPENSEVQPITTVASITNLRVEFPSYFTISEAMTAIT